MTPMASADELLLRTSRTFAIPIGRLEGELKSAVAAAYLCLRAIDEVEDHPTLDPETKVAVLQGMADALQGGRDRLAGGDFEARFRIARGGLPEVTLRVAEWASMPDSSIAPRIWDATAAMADRMARWVESGWEIRTEADLDRYTFGVAGAVGLLLCDLWAWHDGTFTDRVLALGFGRGLQSVNILRNRREDRDRRVDFYPGGWDDSDMDLYARRNLKLGSAYTASLPAGPIKEFCEIPLALAEATLDVMGSGGVKLTRDDVASVVAGVDSKR